MHRKSAKIGILAGIFIVTAVICINFWPSIKIYLAPKTVLTAALIDTYNQLEQRTEHSPVLLLGKVLDFEAGNTVDLTLETHNNLLGPVQYNMHTQMQWNPRRILSKGEARTKNKQIDLSLYLDGNFAAVSSASLLQGRYFGLTYDTFPKDIRSNALWAMMLGSDTLRNWESGVQELQSCMNADIAIPHLQNIDFRSLLVGILALRAEVETEDGYHVISFETTGRQISSAMDYLQTELPISLRVEEEVEFSFWLKNDQIVLIQADAEDLEFSCYFGNNTLTDEITVNYQNRDQKLSVTISTAYSSASYQETIRISGANPMSVSYQWDLTTGDLLLDINQSTDTHHLDLNLTPTAEGLHLSCSDMEGLMHVLLNTKDTADSSGAMLISRGEDFATPEYKNFMDWTLDDLAMLLGSIGSLFGLQIS